MIALYFPDTHPSFPMWKDWCKSKCYTLVSRIGDLKDMSGDLLFLVSCTEIIGKEVYGRFKNACVVHESDLPEGRGWSPLAWQILEGRNEIVISIIKCADKVDRGDILAKFKLHLDGTELWDEINLKRFEIRKKLVQEVIEKNPIPVPQVGEPTYYKKRTPAHSELDIEKSIESQFDLMRICDPRFPTFFNIRGCRYILRLEKA